MGYIAVNSIAEELLAPSRPQEVIDVDGVRLHLVVVSDFKPLEAAWRALESRCNFDPYQSYDWFYTYWRSGSAGADAELQIVAGIEETSGLVFAAPLAVRTGLAGRVGAMLGDQNGAHRAPAICPKLAGMLDDQAGRALLKAIARLAHLDALLLEQQPAELHGHPTPWHDLGAIEHREAIADALIDRPWRDYDAAHRSSKTRSKEKNRLNALKRIGEVEFKVYRDQEERQRVLATLLAHKSAVLRECGVSVFDDRATRKFLRDLVNIQRPEGDFAHLCALTVNGEIVAASLGVVQGTTFSGLILSVGDKAYARYSPGQLIISHLLEHMASTGISRFSFGLGESDLKARWTDLSTELFSTAIPFSVRGSLACVRGKLAWWAKDSAKNSQIMYHGLCYARTALYWTSRWWRTPWYASL